MKKIIGLILLVALVGCSSPKESNLITTTCEMADGSETYTMVMRSREDGQIVEGEAVIVYNLEQTDPDIVEELQDSMMTEEELKERATEEESYYDGDVTYEITQVITDKEFRLTQAYKWTESEDSEKVSPLDTLDEAVEGLEMFGFTCK